MLEIKTQIIGAPEESSGAKEGAATPSGSAPTLKNGDPWAEGAYGETAEQGGEMHCSRLGGRA